LTCEADLEPYRRNEGILPCRFLPSSLTARQQALIIFLIVLHRFRVVNVHNLFSTFFHSKALLSSQIATQDRVPFCFVFHSFQIMKFKTNS